MKKAVKLRRAQCAAAAVKIHHVVLALLTKCAEIHDLLADINLKMLTACWRGSGNLLIVGFLRSEMDAHRHFPLK